MEHAQDSKASSSSTAQQRARHGYVRQRHWQHEHTAGRWPWHDNRRGDHGHGSKPPTAMTSCKLCAIFAWPKGVQTPLTAIPLQITLWFNQQRQNTTMVFNYIFQKLILKMLLSTPFQT
jgi:hypothetical protein